nr:DNA mismatch repair protein MutS [Bacillota bacterium]
PILLITGPNMAGKSTYMRQVALTVILAQMGCFVPAKRARIPIVDRIFTRIGASDDLAGGHSTFMVEMVETRAALLGATRRSLLLLDEIGRGTSTYDGMALAQAVIEYLHDRVGAKTLFSTHYHELTVLGERLPGVVNVHAACSEQDGKLVFLHKILPGKADKSYGIHVAERAGLPPELIERARAILAELEGDRDGAGRPSPASTPASPDAVSGEPQQLSFTDWLFTPPRDPEEEAVLEAIRRLDPERTTPLEALQLLFEWKRRLTRKSEVSSG